MSVDDREGPKGAHYEVGYKKLPKHRIKKGERLNPHGRPKKAKKKNYAEFLSDLLNELVISNGSKMSKGEILLRNLIAKAVEDPRLALKIFAIGSNTASATSSATPDELRRADAQILQNYFDRLARKAGQIKSDDTAPSGTDTIKDAEHG